MSAATMTLAVVLDDQQVGSRLATLIDRVLSGETALVIALAIALGVGMLHALAPGHGKVLVGAWLLGGHGRPRDAVALGLLVGVMHTASVVALGTVVVALGRAPQATWWPDVLIALTGLAVAGVGVRALRRRRHAHHHPHVHAAPGATAATATSPTAPTDDLPARDPAAPDRPAGVAPMSRAGIAALAASGGLVPSPGALALLAPAVAVGRPSVGLVLVIAFGLGLGATLTVIGLAILRGREALLRGLGDEGFAARLTSALPTLSALAVVVAGLVITAFAAVRLIA